jgi:hypothetical protein
MQLRVKTNVIANGNSGAQGPQGTQLLVIAA